MQAPFSNRWNEKGVAQTIAAVIKSWKMDKPWFIKYECSEEPYIYSMEFIVVARLKALHVIKW